MKKITACLAAVLLILNTALLLLPAAAKEGDAAPLTFNVSVKGIADSAKLFDRKHETYAAAARESSLTVSAKGNISFLYLKFNHAPAPYSVISGENMLVAGGKGYLHEYVEIRSGLGETATVTLFFPEGAEVAEVYAYGEGNIPDDVQIWEPMCEKADLLVLSAHADDDQLYFAGLVPYYAAVRGLRVQVVFFTEHFNENIRWHERLDALWINGLRNYPLVSEFPDQLSHDLDTAYRNFAKHGFSEQAIVDWLALQLRTFRPTAAVSHSFTGEYGHGQHLAAADALCKAADRAADASFVTEGAGVFDLPKLYIHNYGTNVVTLSCIDEPSDRIGGKTPFRLSQEGYIAHDSQLVYEDLRLWLYGSRNPAIPDITAASQITEDTPLTYGLFRAGAGMAQDEARDDLFEHTPLYHVTGPVEDPVTEPVTEPLTEPVTEPETGSEGSSAPETDPGFPAVTGGEAAGSEPSVPGSEVSGAADTSAPGTERGPELPAEDTLGELAERLPSRRPLLVLVAVAAAIALILVLYFGIVLIRRCDNR